jgi:hypothetical protein
MTDKTATLTKAHENNLLALIRDYGQALQRFLGDGLEQAVRTWYEQERERFEYPEGREAGPATVLDFVPVLTRKAVEERIQRLLSGRQQALGAA